jgi:hypothetical protein
MGRGGHDPSRVLVYERVDVRRERADHVTMMVIWGINSICGSNSALGSIAVPCQSER